VQKGKVRFFNFCKSAKRKSEVFSILGRVQRGKLRFFGFKKVQKGKVSLLSLPLMSKNN
jgi:hypothetical protein